MEGAVVGRGGLLVDSGSLTGAISDAGEIVYNGAQASTLSGSLSGNGVLIDDQAATVMVSADAASFKGQVQLQSGSLDLATSEGVGKAQIVFLGGDQTKTLRIEAADTPASGHTYGNPLENFDTSSDRLDLAGVNFTSGATATVSGSTLTLKDGAYTAAFTLSGSISTDYVCEPGCRKRHSDPRRGRRGDGLARAGSGCLRNPGRGAERVGSVARETSDGRPGCPDRTPSRPSLRRTTRRRGRRPVAVPESRA